MCFYSLSENVFSLTFPFWGKETASYFESAIFHFLSIVQVFFCNLTQLCFATAFTFLPLIGQQEWPRDSVPWAPHFRSSDVQFGA